MRPIFLLPLMAVLVGCDSGGDDIAAVTRSDSAGVTVVHYARLDTTRVWVVADQPALSIGQVEGEAPYLLTMASQAQRLRDGSVLVVENRDTELRFYDAKGVYLRTVGNAGEGPGEFRWMDWADLIHGDSILVWDGQLRRVSVFTDDGQLGRLTNPTMPEGVHLLIGRGAFSDGSLLVAPLGDYRPDYVLGTMVQDTITYARWDPLAPESLDTVVRIPVQSTYIDENASLWPVPFTPNASEAIGPSSVLSTGGAAFTFDRHLQDGRHVLRVTVEHSPRLIQADELRQYKANRLAAARDQTARAALERRLQELPIPDRYPVLDKVVIDSGGAFWIRLYNPDESLPQSWHVFDTAGSHLAFVRTPAGLEISDIHEDAILGRWRDDLGVRTVRMYALNRAVHD